jgi:hypothetical protein
MGHQVSLPARRNPVWVELDLMGVPGPRVAPLRGSTLGYCRKPFGLVELRPQRGRAGNLLGRAMRPTASRKAGRGAETAPYPLTRGEGGFAAFACRVWPAIYSCAGLRYESCRVNRTGKVGGN